MLFIGRGNIKIESRNASEHSISKIRNIKSNLRN